jgi:hypothetical protein
MSKQITKNGRDYSERFGAVSLALVTMLGAVSMAKVSRNFFKEVTTNPAFAFSQVSERENETGRIPVRFDNIITSQSHGGL